MKKLERTRIWRSAYTEGWTDGLARHLDNEVRAENKALQNVLDQAALEIEGLRHDVRMAEQAYEGVQLQLKDREESIRIMEQRADDWFQENQG